MNKKSNKSFVVIGSGRVATAIARALILADYHCLGLFGRDQDRIKQAAEFAGARGFTSLDPQIINSARIILIGVPDDTISQIASALAEMPEPLEKQLLIHFSGLLSSQVLYKAGKRIGGVASVHPNMAFADYKVAISRIPGTYFGIEGDKDGIEVAEEIVKALGGVPVKIPSSNKAAYHLAAVLSSNATLVLCSIAVDILCQIGVNPEDSEKIISKLVLGTAKNIDELGILKALTGPVVRGDVDTVKAHLKVLETLPGELGDIYRILFKKMVSLGIKAERGDSEKYAPIMKALS